MKYIIVPEQEIYIGLLEKAVRKEVEPLSGFYFLATNNYLDNVYRSYKKFNKEQMQQMRAKAIVGELLENDVLVRPKLMIDQTGQALIRSQKAVGDFNTVVTHNFCDSSTWNNASDSSFIIGPGDGEIWKFVKGETQFSGDMAISPNIFYINYYVWVNPDIPPIKGRVVPFGNKSDIFDLGNKHYSSPTQEELPTGMVTVEFDYPTSLVFYGSYHHMQLAYMEFVLENHTQLAGQKATVSMVTVAG